MTKKNEVYKCDICGNVVSVVSSGAGTLVCCGENMNLLEEQFDETGENKHIPKVEEISGGIRVSWIHPMEESHYISLVQILNNDIVLEEKHLSSDSDNFVDFSGFDKNIKVRLFCNVHGLWISKR